MAEMVDETMESLDEEEDELDEEANEEIEKVLFDITNGKLGEMGGKVGAIPVSSVAVKQYLGDGRSTLTPICRYLYQATAQPEAEEEESEAMRRQLDALLGQ